MNESAKRRSGEGARGEGAFATREAQSGMFYRDFLLERAEVKNDAREATLTFSSETPVPRWYDGNEILLHGPDNVDLSRLRAMGAGLLNHNASMIVGPVKRVWIEDKRGKAVLGFDEDDLGNSCLAKVTSGSLRGVSVGYQINQYRRLEENETWEGYTGPAIIATRWTPYEISLTPIPADATVGVGRSMSRALEGIEPENQRRGEKAMDPKEIKEMIALAVREAMAGLPKTADLVAAVRQALAEDAAPKMRVDAATLLDITGRAAAVSLECKSEVMDLALQGKNEAELLRHITTAATKAPDAQDKGSGDGDGTGRPAGNRGASFKVVDDDLFARSLTSPQAFVN